MLENNTDIEVKNVSKVFDNKKAVENATFAVKKGTIHGFIGPNGAGKSTILNSICGLVVFNEGEIFVENKSVLEDSSFNVNLGYIESEPNFPEDLAVIDYLENFVAYLRDVPFEEFKEKFNSSSLVDFKEKKCTDLSTGWKRILQFFSLSIYKPRIIVADEPFNGLDPTFRKKLMNSFIKCKEEGRTVIISTHILNDLQVLADDITMIKEGKVVYSGPKKENIEELYEEFYIKKDTEKDFSF